MDWDINLELVWQNSRETEKQLTRATDTIEIRNTYPDCKPTNPLGPGSWYDAVK